MRRRRPAVPAVLLAAVALLSSCVGAAGSPRTGAPQQLVVFAASSLDAPFTELGREFQASRPGVRVRFSFDGSAGLLDQLGQGAPADVLATADRPTMDRAVSAGHLAGQPVRFATNTLTLVVPPGNPAGITGLDTSLEGTKLVVCADGVPCGTAARRLAALAGVTLRPVSEETKVADVRAKVESGQADAGLVYVTDAAAAGERVEAIAVARAGEVANDYLAGVVATSSSPELAGEFVAFVAGERGREVLETAGFGR